MARKQEPQAPARKRYAVVRAEGKKPEAYEAEAYYSIFFALLWLGVDRFASKDGAQWCFRASAGTELEVKDGITITIEERECAE